MSIQNKPKRIYFPISSKAKEACATAYRTSVQIRKLTEKAAKFDASGGDDCVGKYKTACGIKDGNRLLHHDVKT